MLAWRMIVPHASHRAACFLASVVLALVLGVASCLACCKLSCVAWSNLAGALCERAGFAQYATAFVDEQVTGKRLLRLTEDVLKKKLHVTSLGHRKELMRHLDSLLRARKAFLKY